MKTLFVIRAMLRDWLTVHRRYTLIIVLTMILSVQALFFVATKNASENIESIFLERFCNAAYTVKPPKMSTETFEELEESERLYPEHQIKCDRVLLESYIASGLPMPAPMMKNAADYSAHAYLQVTGINGESWYKAKGEPFYNFGGLPVFEEKDSEFAQVINMSGFSYEICAGRDYTPEDLASHAPVLVVERKEPFAVGDRIKIGERELEIIGLSDSGEDCFDSPIPFWLLEEGMTNFRGIREYEFEPDHFTDLLAYDCMLLLDRMVYENPLGYGQVGTLAEVCGTVREQIKMPYTTMLDEEFDKFYKATIIECAVFGLFCIANIILAVWSLCVKQIGTLRTFRVYGASNGAVTRMIVTLIMIMTLAAGVIGGALCIPMQKLYENINSNYAWRPYCMYIAVGALMIINLIAAVPTAILIVRRSPIGKQGG